MQNQPTKVNGDSVSADEFNQPNDELENIITSSGQTLSGSTLDQAAKAIADYSGGVTYYLETGAADAYVLSVTGTFKAPTAYREGMEIRFRAANANTGAATVNVSSLGIKNIKKADGSAALSAGDITSTHDTILRYNGTSFVLVSLGALQVNNLTSTNQTINDNLTLGNKFNATANTATIASGAITYTGMNMIIDTEGAAASDDLTTINGMVAGDVLILKIANAARNVVIKNSASLITSTATDVTLDLISDCIIFHHNGTGICEVDRGVSTDFTNLKNANGYTYLPNSLIMQWGITALNTDTVAFPLTFPSTLLSLNIVAHGNIATAPVGNLYSKNTSSTSGFTTYTKDVAVYLIWYAIGY